MSQTVVLTFQANHPSWINVNPFKIVITEPKQKRRHFIVHEIVDWRERYNSPHLSKAGVEVWVTKVKGILSDCVIQEQLVGDPFLRYYKLSVPSPSQGEEYRVHYPLTFEQGECLKLLGCSFI